MAECVIPSTLIVDVGLSVSTTASRADAPGSATLVDGAGAVCFAFGVTATMTITQDTPSLLFTQTETRPGEYISTLSAPAQAGSCYASTIDAEAALLNRSDYAGPICWAGPPGGDGCGYTGTCEQSESCPLILDLNGDGIHTTGLEAPVYYWIDLMGRAEATAWTNPFTEEAFLWIDLNRNHTAQVAELFGSRMVAWDGEYYANGFEALLQFDRAWYGGNEDGRITSRDSVWPRLRLWVDRNHDAESQPGEISVPSSHGIIALNLSHAEGDAYDENGNELYLVSSYVVRRRGKEIELRMMADVEFKYIPN